MSHENIIRAWKDNSYRQSLSAEEQAQLPENPAGLVELSNADLNEAVGGGVMTVSRICTAHSAVDACPSSLGCTFKCPI